MPTLISTKEQPLTKVLPAPPSVLITMPFEPKLNDETQLKERVRTVVKKAEKLLLTQYSITAVNQVIEQLNIVFGKLNFHGFKKSVAVFVSASSHKVLYLDLKLREEIQLSNSFQMGNLLQLKEHPVEYLVVVLNDHWAKTYYGNQAGFKLVKTDRPKPFSDVEQAGSYSIECRRKAVHGCLYRQITDDFTLMANAYALPVFLIGSVRNVYNFSQIVNSLKDVTQVVYANTDNISEAVIFQKLKPYFLKWNYIKLRYLRRQLQEADSAGLLSHGSADVINCSNRADGKLLLIEAHYPLAPDEEAVHLINSDGEMVPTSGNSSNKVESMVETFLQNGGDVEILPAGFLKDYNRIAVITAKAGAIFNHEISSGGNGYEMF